MPHDRVTVYPLCPLNTMRRWVRQAREKILEQTRNRLAQRLDITSTQLESVIRFVQDGPAARLVGLLRMGDE